LKSSPFRTNANFWLGISWSKRLIYRS
jgi:hypothetical protein